MGRVVVSRASLSAESAIFLILFTINNRTHLNEPDKLEWIPNAVGRRRFPER